MSCLCGTMVTEPHPDLGMQRYFRPARFAGRAAR